MGTYKLNGTNVHISCRSSSAVDRLQFTLCPLDNVLRRHALDRLCVHVDDDVFGEHFSRLLAGRSRIARRLAQAPRNLVGLHYWILAPELVALPLGRRRSSKTLLGLKPLLVVGWRVHPPQKFFGSLLIL